MFRYKNIFHFCQLPLCPLSVSDLQRVCIPAFVVWKIAWKKNFFPSKEISGSVGEDVCRERSSWKQTSQGWAPRILVPHVSGSLWNYVSSRGRTLARTRCVGGSDLGPPCIPCLESHGLERKLPWFPCTVLHYSDLWLEWVSLWLPGSDFFLDFKMH